MRLAGMQMLKMGWVVKRAPAEGTPEGASDSVAPVLVHRCNDERTLTAAAGRLGRSLNGELCLPQQPTAARFVVFFMADERLWFAEYSSQHLRVYCFCYSVWIFGDTPAQWLEAVLSTLVAVATLV